MGAEPARPGYSVLLRRFTAGPGMPNELPDPLGCFRSDQNYLHVVARAQGFTLGDRSCSGADTSYLSRCFSATGPKVGAAPAEAARRSPGARIFMIGYPAVLPEVGPGMAAALVAAMG